MDTILLYSDNLLLMGRWMKLINTDDHKTKVNIVENQKELENVTNSILILNNTVCQTISIKFIESFINNQNQIILLDKNPDISNAKRYLELGIKAYADISINNKHLNCAIKALKNDHIWLLPDIANELMN